MHQNYIFPLIFILNENQAHKYINANAKPNFTLVLHPIIPADTSVHP